MKQPNNNFENNLMQYLNKGEPPCDYEAQLFQNHFSRIRAILENKVVPPYELEIQPSGICNLACKHCFGRDYVQLPNLINSKSIADIAIKVDEFVENGFGIEIVKFCGTTGEPLVNPVIVDGIRIFKGLGKKVIVFTNGLLLDKKIPGTTKKYYDAISDADKLNLSLDADSEETFKRVKGVNGFKKIISCLEDMVLKKDGLNITVSYVISKLNYEGILPLTKLLREVGVDKLLFRVDFVDIDAINYMSEILIGKINEAKTYSGNGFDVVPVYDNKSIKDDCSAFHSYGKKCFNQHFWACIGPDCNLYACGHRTHGGVVSYGNLLENRFQDLWTGKLRQKNLHSLPDEYCKYCSPSSSRRNEFMTFLSKIPVDELKNMHENMHEKVYNPI